MSRGMLLGLCAVIVAGGSVTLFMPFTDYGVQLRAQSAESRLSPSEIRARGGGSRGSMWSNIEDAKRRQRERSTDALAPRESDERS